MSSPSQNEWSPCRKGELTEIARAAKGRLRRRRWLSASSLVAVAAVAIWVGVSIGPAGAKPEPLPPLTCSETVQLYEGYVAGQLDEEVSERVEVHLDHCPACRRHLDHVDRKST